MLTRQILSGNLPTGEGSTAYELNAYLNQAFKEYEQKYGIEATPSDSLSNRFDAIIQSAFKQTGQQVAILVDEYDSPLQHSWKTPHHEECTTIYRNVFAILKNRKAGGLRRLDI